MLEAYIEDESLGDAGDDEARAPRGHDRRRDHAGAARLRLQEQGRAAAARRGHRLPAEPARRSADGRHRPEVRGRDRASAVARPAVLRPGLQGHVRPVRRQADVLPRLLRHAQGRRPRAQHDHRQDRARQPHPPDAREPPRGARLDHRRRDRGRRRPQEHDDGRHARRRERPDRARVDDVPRARDPGRGRAEVEGRPGQARQRAAAARRGGPDVPRLIRRGDGPDPDRRHGRAASRDHRRPAEARVQRRRERRPAAGRLPRDGGQGRRQHSREVRPPDRRLGPVRGRRHQPASAGARARLRVQRQDRRRQDPEGVHPGGRRGHQGGHGLRRARGLSGRRHRDRARRRVVPRGRLERARLQDRRLDGVQGGPEALEAEAARARHGRRGDDPGGLPRRRDGEPQQPPRAHRVDEPPRQRAGHQGQRAAFGDVRICNRPALDDAGPGRLHHAVRSLRRSASVDRERHHRRSGLTRKSKEQGATNGQAEVRAHEAARQRRHHRSHRPRQDDADRSDHEGARRTERRHGSRFRRDRQGAGGAAARHHDQHRACRVRDGEPSLRARRLPWSRRLHQEHDHRRRADGRRDPRRLGRRRPDAADPRAHPARAPGRGAGDRRRAEQGRHGRRRRAARARRAGGARAPLQVRVPRRRHPGRARLGAEGARGRRGVDAEDHRADGRGRLLHPGADARRRQAVPHADRGRLHDHRPRHRRDRAHRAGQDRVGQRGRDHRHPPRGREDRRHGPRDVPEDARLRAGRRQRGRTAARYEARGGGARPGAREAGLDHASHALQGRGLRALEGRGRPPHAVLQRLPAAVLLPHDGRDRCDQAPGGPGDGHAGRQHEHGDRAHPADRHGSGSPVRHPRRRPHRGCGRRHRDPQVERQPRLGERRRRCHSRRSESG